MTTPQYVRPRQLDPILGAFDLGYPIDFDVLEQAKLYRRALIHDLQEEIAILEQAIIRMLGEDPG
jgi:hypothetical protein